ncbi:hypothetical protein [Halosolutus halophilus]|uniref:hypothetical protein n=1 Tax=Halosolutus halophilus TaxID=1552990 RepID=UPI0022352400|nr:hypothetical protein [Halosolutus halophilus]
MGKTNTDHTVEAADDRGIVTRCIHAVTVLGMALLVGLFAAWVTPTLGVAGPAFGGAVLVSAVYLSRNPIPRAAGAERKTTTERGIDVGPPDVAAPSGRFLREQNSAHR